MQSVLVTIRNQRLQLQQDRYESLVDLKRGCVSLMTSYTPVGDPIAETNLSEVCLAYNTMKGINGYLSPDEKNLFNSWVRNLCQKTIDDYNTLTPGMVNLKNNFQSHRIKILACGALSLRDTNLMAVASKWLEAHLEENLLQGGLCLDFTLRDSCTYTVYSLEPICVAIHSIFRLTGVNYFTYKNKLGVNLPSAVRWLLPYIQGVKTNVMFINSIYDSDKAKTDYGKIWNKSNCVNLVNLCIPFDASFIDFF